MSMSDIYGVNMLGGNGSQYLHPDYLQPLPTTLDAKKSPLALLAQTCSSIGKDSNVPPSKPIIPPIEKKDTGKTSPNKVSDSGSKCGDFSEKRESDGESSRQHERAVRSPKLSTESYQSAMSCDDKTHEDKVQVQSTSARSSPSGARASPRDRIAEKSPQNRNCSSTDCDNHHENSSTKRTKSPVLSTASSVSSSKPGSAGHPLQPSISFGSTLPPGYPMMSVHGLPMDPALASAYSSLGAHAMNGLGLGSPLASSALKSTLAPYVSYSRIRTSNGSAVIPVCRDPYCTNCQLSLQNSHLSSTCTAAGCTQCAHEKSLLASMCSPSATLPHTLPHSFAGLNGYGSSPMLGNSSLFGASMYPYSLLSSSPAHGLPPFVCNWVAGSDYCGKRFVTSEELLQHLRTHTAMSESQALYPLGLMPPSASALAALHAHYTSPGSLSPNSSMRRSYPLSLSPVNSALNAGRFHPYKTAMPPMQPSPSLVSHPTLAPYYSPYSLYAQRIGAGAP